MIAREQLSAAKKRIPKRTISTSTRCLTGGDAVYENEFIDVPKSKRHRAKVLGQYTDIDFMAQIMVDFFFSKYFTGCCY